MSHVGKWLLSDNNLKWRANISLASIHVTQI